MKKNMLSCGGAFFSLAVLVVISASAFSSCASGKNVTGSVAETPDTESAPAQSIDTTYRHTPSLNHSYLTEMNIGENISVKGRLIKDDSGWSLLENENSRSRVTFVLEFDENQKWPMDYISSLVNNNVEISGILSSVQSTWVKVIKVVEIK